MSLVRFGSKRCGSDIIIIYYSCNSWVVNLEQTLQRQWMTWLWCHSQQRQQVNNAIAKLCFGRVLKRSLCAHLMRVKLLLFTFYLNGGLHAVSIGKLSERRSNSWAVRFFKNRIRTKFQFSTHPCHSSLLRVSIKHLLCGCHGLRCCLWLFWRGQMDDGCEAAHTRLCWDHCK